MSGPKINPEKITSPLQLMAAWFAMLVLLVPILLAAAIKIDKPEWAAGYLVIFTSFTVMAVLGCVTLMLTVFRPHLQEGKEYAQWLKDKNIYSPGYLKVSQPSKQQKFHRNQIISRTIDKIDKSFLINLSDLPGVLSLIESLAKAGFHAEIYRSSEYEIGDERTFERQESIWVGSALHPKGVIQSTKIAVTKWPHLRYMHLSNDGESPPAEVHHSMYFGGASSTAEELRLSPWSAEEILRLDENISQNEFHKIIRSKYS